MADLAETGAAGAEEEGSAVFLEMPNLTPSLGSTQDILTPPLHEAHLVLATDLDFKYTKFEDELLIDKASKSHRTRGPHVGHSNGLYTPSSVQVASAQQTVWMSSLKWAKQDDTLRFSTAWADASDDTILQRDGGIMRRPAKMVDVGGSPTT